MNKTFFKYILCLVSITLFTVDLATAQSVKVEASLQDFTIKIGDQTKLFLIVNQPVNERVIFPQFQDTITGQVQIVEVNKADTVVDKQDKNRITITQAYTITSFEAGIHNLPAFSFNTSKDALTTNSLTIQVQTVKIDTSKAIHDIKQPIAVTYTFVDWLRDNWIWIAIGIVAIALIAYIIYYLRNKPKQVPVVTKAEPVIPAHTIAVKKLEDLKARKLWQQEEFKEYHTELTDIMREYLENRYKITTHEKTTHEILSSLNNRKIEAEYLEVLKQILSLADLVKFAKLKPLPPENEGSMDNALAFVLKTKLDDIATVNTQTDGGSGHEAV